MCNGGTENSPIEVEGPKKICVSDGMVESAFMDITYELKRARICTKKDRSFMYLGFLHTRNQSMAQEKAKALLIILGLIQIQACSMVHREIKKVRSSALAPC